MISKAIAQVRTWLAQTKAIKIIMEATQNFSTNRTCQDFPSVCHVACVRIPKLQLLDVILCCCRDCREDRWVLVQHGMTQFDEKAARNHAQNCGTAEGAGKV